MTPTSRRGSNPSSPCGAGKFKPAVGLERLQSATDIKFVERGFPTNLVPSRDVGLQLAGGSLGRRLELFGGHLQRGFPIWRAVSTMCPIRGSGGQAVHRAFARRSASSVDLGVGFAASTGKELGTTANTALASYRAPGQATIFRYIANNPATIAGTVIANGRRSRLSPQGYLNVGGIGLLGEYVISRQTVTRDTAVLVAQTRRLEHKAWEVTGSFLLTGEKASLPASLQKAIRSVRRRLGSP